MFDGSSIAGWKSIDQSDMKLIPDAGSVYIDPFYAEKTLCVHCNVVEPDTGEAYSRDPRGTAVKAEAYLKASGIGDVAYFGPEAEFFIFDDVRYSVTPAKVAYQIDADAAAWNTDSEYEMGNLAHRAGHKGGYFPGEPDRRGPGPARRDALDHEAHGHEGGQAPPRSGDLPARTRADLRRADRAGRQHPEIQVCHPQRRGRLRQDRDLHAEAHEGRQRLGDARQHVDLEGRQAALRWRQICRPEPGSPVVHRRHPEARQGAERADEPGHQQLQAADPGLRGSGAARLLGPQPLGLRPYSVDRVAEGQARRSPFPRSVGEPVSRLCGAADGRPSTASRTRSIRARHRTRTSTTCRRKNWPPSRPSAARSARRWKSWRRTTTSCSPATCSPRTNSRATWRSSGKRSMPTSTRRTRWNIRCTTAADPGGEGQEGRLRAPFFFGVQQEDRGRPASARWLRAGLSPRKKRPRQSAPLARRQPPLAGGSGGTSQDTASHSASKSITTVVPWADTGCSTVPPS